MPRFVRVSSYRVVGNTHSCRWQVGGRPEAKNGDTRAGAGGNLDIKLCFYGASHNASSEALCPRPRHSLDHHSLLFCPAPHRCGNSDFSPSLLLGRNRQRVDYSVVPIAHPFLEKTGADWLRVCAAGPERLEPRATL